MIQDAKKLPPIIQQVSKEHRVSLLVQGEEVPHFHLHLIPSLSNQALLIKKQNVSQEQLLEVQKQIIQGLTN